MKVETPVKGYSGIAAGVVFADGVGYTDSRGAMDYFRLNGYAVSEGDAPEGGSPLSVAGAEYRGQPSVDAAVVRDAAGPVSDAFLPPTNVGAGNDPHGSKVVNPGLHAMPPGPIVPGVVGRTPAEQQARETQVQRAALTTGDPVDVSSKDNPSGPLGLSDPGSVDQGPDAADKAAQKAAKSSSPRRNRA